VLNACRALRFVTDGILCSKTAGGLWALDQRIAPEVVEHALRDRRGDARDPIDAAVGRAWVRSIADQLDLTSSI
jgi:hypothetical protein